MLKHLTSNYCTYLEVTSFALSNRHASKDLTAAQSTITIPSSHILNTEMSICIACQGQLEAGSESVCLPAYLSKDRTWLTHSGGVNSLLVINLALPVEAACQEHLPGSV